jgi:hypothetical protein
MIRKSELASTSTWLRMAASRSDSIGIMALAAQGLRLLDSALPLSISKFSRPDDRGFSKIMSICADYGIVLTKNRLVTWSLDTAEKVSAAASIIAEGADVRNSAWSTPGAWWPWASHPERLNAVGHYADVVRAYLLVGGQATESVRGGVQQGVLNYRGCPGLQHFFRSSAGLDCDMETTRSAWLLEIALGEKPY